MNNYDLFIQGFATGSNLSINEADQAWAAWSIQLSDNERDEIEQLGLVMGINEGKKYHNGWHGN